jgi:hypothetical protein
MGIEFRKLVSQLVILLSRLFWLLYHSITMIRITSVIKKLSYLPTSSSLICPAVISNISPLNLVPVWFVNFVSGRRSAPPGMQSRYHTEMILYLKMISHFDWLSRRVSQNCKKSDFKIRHVRPSVLSARQSTWHNSDPHWTDFHEIWYRIIFRKKKFMKIQFSLKLDKNNGYFVWRPKYIFDHISLSSS